MKIQKRLAGQLLNASKKRIKFDPERLADIKEAITKTDIRQLIDDKAITKTQEKGVSRARANKIKSQKSKGKQKGPGTRKGKRTARAPRKETWMNKIRSQRQLLNELKDNENISKETYRSLYKKAKGGFFRSKRHIKIYLDEHDLFIKKETKTTKPKPQKKKRATKKKQTKPTTKKNRVQNANKQTTEKADKK